MHIYIYLTPHWFVMDAYILATLSNFHVEAGIFLHANEFILVNFGSGILSGIQKYVRI